MVTRSKFNFSGNTAVRSHGKKNYSSGRPGAPDFCAPLDYHPRLGLRNSDLRPVEKLLTI